MALLAIHLSSLATVLKSWFPIYALRVCHHWHICSITLWSTTAVKRCHLACPNISHSWPAHSPPSSQALLGCLDESVIIRAFIQSTFSCSTALQSALYVCSCLRPELGIQQIKGRRKKSGRFIWFTISIQS